MTPRQRRLLAVALASALAGCGEPAARDTAAPADTPTTPEETLAKFAGTWQVHARTPVGDSLPSHTVHATADTAGWTLSFPDHPPIPLRILDASGDLVVMETHPYQSVLRPGVQVTVMYITRLHGDSTSGRLVAMYDVDGANAILRGVTHGSRQP